MGVGTSGDRHLAGDRPLADAADAIADRFDFVLDDDGKVNWRRAVLSTLSQEWIDAMEDLTGLDIDGDGKVGEQQPKESPPPTPKPPEKPDMIACRFQCGFEHALMEVVCHHELRGGVRSQPPSPPLLPHLRLICTRKGFLLCAR